MAYTTALSKLAAYGVFEPTVVAVAKREGISLLAAARRLLAACV